MADNVKELNPKQLGAIHSLLTKHSVAEAAKDAHVTPTTVYRWLDEPEFRRALTQAEGAAIDAAARGLVGLTEKALNTISTVLDDSALHPATRLRAAEVVLSNMLKLVELRNLNQRIEALEKAQNGQ